MKHLELIEQGNKSGRTFGRQSFKSYFCTNTFTLTQNTSLNTNI